MPGKSLSRKAAPPSANSTWSSKDGFQPANWLSRMLGRFTSPSIRHADLVSQGIKKLPSADRYIAAKWLPLVVEPDDKLVVLQARHSRHGENHAVDIGIKNGAAKRPALTVGSGQRVEPTRERLFDALLDFAEIGIRDRKSTRLNSSHSQISY